ncbi:MAG: hypothetical protein ACUVV0_01875 [Anaerolineae bacterium]
MNADVDLALLAGEVQKLKDFILDELLPRMERIGERKPLLLYDLRNDKLKLVEPVAVLLEYDEKQVIAVAYDLDVFGYGETEMEALDDLRRTIVDLYLTLKERESNVLKDKGLLPPTGN